VAIVTLDIPDELLAVLPGAPNEVGREIRLAAALHWCQRGELSVSWGAQLAGLTYADFIEEAARRKFELFPLDTAELEQELARLDTRVGGDIEDIKEEIARDQSRRR
jgi:predicted HTH domain antitoxin